MDGQLEYDTGPQFDDEEDPVDDEGDRRGVVDGPWKAGFAAGAGTFLVVFAIMYQLASAILATGVIGSPQPNSRTLAGLLMLGSHGATIESENALSTEFGFVLAFVTPLTAFVVVLALTAAGYLLVRRLARDDLRETGQEAFRAGTVSVGVYILLSIVLAAITRWTPAVEGSDGQTVGAADVGDPETITVSTDLSLVLTVGGTVVTFLALGGLLALYATFVHRSSDDGSGDSSEDEVSAESDPDDDFEADDLQREDEPATEQSSQTESEDRSLPGRSGDADRRYGDPERRYGDSARGYGDGTNRYGNADDQSDRSDVDSRDRYGSGTWEE